MLTRFIDTLFTAKPSGKLTPAAYRESGRIVLAYAFGYRCANQEICIHHSDELSAAINFGPDTFLVNAMVNYKKRPYIIDSIFNNRLAGSSAIADNIAFILTAGAAAQRTYQQQERAENATAAEPDDNEREALQNIDSLLSRYRADHQQTYIAKINHHVQMMMKLPLIWKTIDSLARQFISSPGNKMKGWEIDQVLLRNGYWKMLNE